MQKFLQNENFYKILVYLISNPPDNTIPSLKANHSMLCFKINYSPVAQSVERAAVNRYVVGSSPTGGAFRSFCERRDPPVNARNPIFGLRAFRVNSDGTKGFASTNAGAKLSPFRECPTEIGEEPSRFRSDLRFWRQNSQTLGLTDLSGLTGWSR